MLEPGTVLENKYQVEASIGQGGFGYVYRAREPLTGEIVAIKELVPAFVETPRWCGCSSMKLDPPCA